MARDLGNRPRTDQDPIAAEDLVRPPAHELIRSSPALFEGLADPFGKTDVDQVLPRGDRSGGRQIVGSLGILFEVGSCRFDPAVNRSVPYSMSQGHAVVIVGRGKVLSLPLGVIKVIR